MFKRFTFFSVYYPIIFIFLISISCCDNFEHAQSNGISRFTKNELDQHVNNIIFQVSEGNYTSIDSLIRFFDDENIIHHHPFCVLKAYIAAYSGSYSKTALSKSETNFCYQNLYTKFHALAVKHQSQHLMVYLDYIEARNYQEKEINDKALPKYLNLLPQLHALNDSLAIGLINKRIGLIYLDIYGEYNKAIEHLTKVYLTANDKEEKFKACEYLISCYFYINNCDSMNNYAKSFLEASESTDTSTTNLINLFKQVCIFESNPLASTDSVDKYLIPSIQFFSHTDANKDLYIHLLVPWLNAYLENLINKNEYKVLNKLIPLVAEAEKNRPDYARYHLTFYKTCSKYYDQTGNNQLAFEYLKKYEAEKTNANRESSKNKVEIARIEFETQQHKKQLELESEIELQKQKLIRNYFIAGSIVLILLIIILVNRNKLNRAVEIERMRSRLSRDLHDDIGSTLSSINILSHTAKNNLSNSTDQKTISTLEKINERSQRLLNNMSDIIWNINPEHDNLEEVMSRMREYAGAILEAKGIEYRFNFPKDTNDCKLSMEVKNNIYLIFKEATNNLSKYSRCTKADFSITINDKSIQLQIHDNGIGFRKDQILHNGGLRNMQQRAEEIKGNFKIISNPQEGTKITLELPRNHRI